MKDAVVEEYGPRKLVAAGKEYLNFSGSDYLALSISEVATKALAEGIAHYGTGTSRARTAAHIDCEKAVAEYLGTEAAALVASGEAANTAAIRVLASLGDAVFGDRLNGPSIGDGMRLSRADRIVFNHRDADDLERKLAESSLPGARAVVTETLFALDGEKAPLARIVEIAASYEARICTACAHDFGLYGAEGAGLADEIKVAADLALISGSFANAAGLSGGFIAGKRELVDRIRDAELPPLPAATAYSAAEVIRFLRTSNKAGEARRLLFANASSAAEGARLRGFEVSGAGHIPVLTVGSSRLARALLAELYSLGIAAAPVLPPFVPRSFAGVRIGVNAAHTEEDIKRLLNALEEVRAKVF